MTPSPEEAPLGPDGTPYFDDLPAALAEAFAEITERSPDGIVLYSPGEREGGRDYCRVFVNDTAERILGAPRAALEGVWVKENPAGPLGREAGDLLDQIHRSGAAVSRTVEHGRGAQLQAYRVRGRWTGPFIGIRLMDISARIRGERAVRRREEILRGVAQAGEALLLGSWEEVLPEVLEAIGRATQVLHASLLRFGRGEEPPETLAEWSHPSPDPGVAAEGSGATGSFGSIGLRISVRGEQWGALCLMDADEARRWSQGESEALRSASVLLATAIERELREEEVAGQLWRAQKLDTVGRLAGGVAHDFNNLLTVVRGNTDLARQTIRDGRVPEEELGEIGRAADRGARLAQQLLAFSRRQVLQPVPLDLNRAARDLAQLFRPLIGEHIEVKLDLDEGLWPVLADPAQMEQVLMNLVLNARDAMPRGGKLLVGTANVELDEGYARTHLETTPGEYVLLSVTDEGVGIPRESIDQVFDPFFTTKPHGEGTGLGLSTVYGVVKQSRGAIFVYSEPGEGTTFKIYLPRLGEDAEVRPDLGPWTAQATLEGVETLLLVEDDPAVRAVAARILRRLGYGVRTAASPEIAMERLAEGPAPDLLVTDVVLPGETGRKLAHRAQAEIPELKVLFMSGYTENTTVHHGMLDSGIHFVEKPFTPMGLGRAVRRALDDPEPPRLPPSPRVSERD